MARETPDLAVKPDPSMFDAGEDQDFTFKANYDMITNVFRSGIGRGSSVFKNSTVFPYELDNYQKPIKSLKVSKTFDSDRSRWKTEEDLKKEMDMSRRQQSRLLQLDMQVDYGFNINDVRFNSGLNADVMDALQSEAQAHDLVQPFVADYEINHRQLAIYLIDCEVYECKQFNKLEKLIKDTPIQIIQISKGKKMEVHQLAKQIEATTKAYIECKVPPEVASAEEYEWHDISFIGKPLVELDQYNEQFVFPNINKFKRSLIEYRFKSPLNFIMLGTDFHEFFGMFYHAKLLSQYLVNLLTDSVFSLHALHSANMMDGEQIQKHDYEVKQAAAISMLESLKHKIERSEDMLKEYNHLIDADQADCSMYFPPDQGNAKQTE